MLRVLKINQANIEFWLKYAKFVIFKLILKNIAICWIFISQGAVQVWMIVMFLSYELFNRGYKVFFVVFLQKHTHWHLVTILYGTPSINTDLHYENLSSSVKILKSGSVCVSFKTFLCTSSANLKFSCRFLFCTIPWQVSIVQIWVR